MKRKIVLTVVAMFAAMAALPAAAQDIKIGVINLPRLVAESPQAAQARASMEDEFAGRRAELQSQQQGLQAAVERLRRDGAVMSEEARDKLEASIRDQQRRMQLAKAEYNDEVQQAEEEALESLRGDLQEVIRQFADDGGYNLIIGTGVLYADENVDVTDQVLELLKDQ